MLHIVMGGNTCRNRSSRVLKYVYFRLQDTRELGRGQQCESRMQMSDVWETVAKKFFGGFLRAGPSNCSTTHPLPTKGSKA